MKRKSSDEFDGHTKRTKKVDELETDEISPAVNVKCSPERMRNAKGTPSPAVAMRNNDKRLQSGLSQKKKSSSSASGSQSSTSSSSYSGSDSDSGKIMKTPRSLSSSQRPKHRKQHGENHCLLPVSSKSSSVSTYDDVDERQSDFSSASDDGYPIAAISQEDLSENSTLLMNRFTPCATNGDSEPKYAEESPVDSDTGFAQTCQYKSQSSSPVGSNSEPRLAKKNTSTPGSRDNYTSSGREMKLKKTRQKKCHKQHSRMRRSNIASVHGHGSDVDSKSNKAPRLQDSHFSVIKSEGINSIDSSREASSNSANADKPYSPSDRPYSNSSSGKVSPISSNLLSTPDNNSMPIDVSHHSLNAVSSPSFHESKAAGSNCPIMRTNTLPYPPFLDIIPPMMFHQPNPFSPNISNTLPRVYAHRQQPVTHQDVCSQYVETPPQEVPYLQKPTRKLQRLPPYDEEDFEKIEHLHFIDSHCHLDFLFRREDHKTSYSNYRKYNHATFPKSYEGCIAIFCDPKSFGSSEVWSSLLEEENVWAAFGCHPHMANNFSREAEVCLLEALKHKRVVALGEIGLDYSFKNSCNREVQKDVFKRQLTIAMDKQLPLVIHSRDATEDTLEILKLILPNDYKIHRHCFTGDFAEATKWLTAFPNSFIGLTALVTFPTATTVHDVARRIPLDRLLLETDTPYFVPKRLSRDKKWSHPGMAIHVAAQIAALRMETIEEIIKVTRINTKKMYNI